MKINPKETILSIPILKIRNLLRRDTVLSPENVAKFLKINLKNASAVLNELKKLGYIEVDEESKFKLLKVTIKGNALAMTKVRSPISKEKATLLFSEFMERVNEVNENDFYICKIAKVLLFGSFITEVQYVNDIDIAIEIIKKDTPPEWWGKNDLKVQKAKDSGYLFRSIFEEAGFSELEVRLFLLSKSRYLSFHSMDDKILKQTKTVQVYPVKKVK